MQAFFSCFSCGQKTTTIVTPQPISVIKGKSNIEAQESNIKLISEFQDNKSRSATTVTFHTTDTAPSSVEDEASYIRKKIQQMRKKDLPERKAMQSQFIRQNLSKSNTVYLVQKDWSQLYTAFLKNIATKELRSISNDRLIDSKQNIRTDIRQREDYFIINDRVWKFVQQMYGGGPAIVQDCFFPVFPLSNKKQQMPISGIVNPNNLCYMIAILQCLFSNQHFAYFMLKKQYDDSKRKMIYHSVLNKLSKQLSQSSGRKVEIKDLSALVQNKFSSCEQHDAHQFFLHIVDALQEEAKPQTCIKENGNSPQSAYSIYFKNNKSIADKLFVGQIQTNITCNRCQTVSINYNTFVDLELAISDQLLQNCLKKHFSLQKLDDYECQKCKKKTRCTKQYQITKTPNYLVISLKKFNETGKKIQERVKYPFELQIKKICKGHYGDSKYILQSVLVHKGTKSTKGHYYCYTRRGAKTWNYANDQIYKEIQANEVLGRDAYILFYQRAK